MQLIVIGNGFDLAAKLPTNYGDYFTDYENLNSQTFQVLNEIIFNQELFADPKFPQNKLFDFNNTAKEVEPVRDNIRELYPEVSKGKVLNFLTIVEASQIVEHMNRENMSVWSLFFWFNGIFKDKKYEWNEIETQIKTTLKFDDPLCLLNFQGGNLEEMLEYVEDIPSRNIAYPLGAQKPKETRATRKEDYVNDFKVIHRMQIIVITLLAFRYKNSEIKEKIHLLKLELLLLEKDFQKYIKKIYIKNIRDSHNNSRIYRGNLSKLIDPLDRKCFIINFNYTDLSLTKSSKKFEFYKNKISYDVIQNNVHGVYYDKIIFGIDQKDINVHDKKFTFTKTYRKLETMFKVSGTGLPKKDQINLISFYGHSFSEADYSYFRSIFDYYDLYGSSIKLKFFYSNYKKSEFERSNVTSAIFKLIESYSSNMFTGNSEKTENLFHKLILEGRIMIREIDMNEIMID